MGGCQSTVEAQEEAMDPLERKLVEAIIANNKKQRQQHQERKQQRHASMAALLLAFPKMAPGFVKVKELFRHAVQASNSSGNTLPVAALKQHAGLLGLGKLDEQALAGLLRPTLDAQDLLMVFTIAYLMHPACSADLAPEIKAMLDVVEQAFMHFDSSLDGTLERDELNAVLTQGSEGGNEETVKRRKPKRKQVGIGERLFDLLDFDGSGRVSFKEFILGMEKLVLSEHEEEGESGEASQAAGMADDKMALVAGAQQGMGDAVAAH